MGIRYVLQAGIVLSMMSFVLLLDPLGHAQQQTEPVVAPTSDSPQPAQNDSAKPSASRPAAVASTPAGSDSRTDQELPDSPGTVQQRANKSSSEQAPLLQADQGQQPQSTPHVPLGTAAAESIATTGVAASRPAGAALAPAKQRRVRSILIKVGALVGVGVAIGTTMALSQGSPSKPPGAN